jgi:hypothetical protein
MHKKTYFHMPAPPTQQQPHKSARLGVMSMLLGLVGSAIAYFGLWLESDIVGLIGFSGVAISVVGILTALFWAIGAQLCETRRSKS